MKDERAESRVNQRADELTFFGDRFQGFTKEPSPKLTGAELIADLVKDACSMHNLAALQALARRGVSLLLPDLLPSEQPVFALLEHFYYEYVQAFIEIDKKIQIPLAVVEEDEDLNISDDHPFIRLLNPDEDHQTNYSYYYIGSLRETCNRIKYTETFTLVKFNPFDTLRNNVQDLLECLGANAKDIWREDDWIDKRDGLKFINIIRETCSHLLSGLYALQSYEMRAIFRHIERRDTKAVECYLKKDQNLVYGEFTQLYKIRGYTNTVLMGGLTMFQIAFWEENKTFCELILRYLPIDKAREQWQSFYLRMIEVQCCKPPYRFPHKFTKEHTDWYATLNAELSINNSVSSKTKLSHSN